MTATTPPDRRAAPSSIPWPPASPACSRRSRRWTCRRAAWPISAPPCAACAGCWARRRSRSRPTPACSAARCAGPCRPPPGSAPARWANIKSLVLQGLAPDRLPGPAGPLAAPAHAGLGGARCAAADQVRPGRALAPDALLRGAGDPAGRGRPGGVRSLRRGDPERQLHPQPAGRAPDRGPAVEPGGRDHPGLAAAAHRPAALRQALCAAAGRVPGLVPGRGREPGCAGSPARARSRRGRCGRCGRARSSSGGSICARRPRPWCKRPRCRQHHRPRRSGHGRGDAGDPALLSGPQRQPADLADPWPRHASEGDRPAPCRCVAGGAGAARAHGAPGRTTADRPGAQEPAGAEAVRGSGAAAAAGPAAGRDLRHLAGARARRCRRARRCASSGPWRCSSCWWPRCGWAISPGSSSTGICCASAPAGGCATSC